MPHNPDVEQGYSSRVQAVVENPHITDWFFSSKLSDWIHHWLYMLWGQSGTGTVMSISHVVALTHMGVLNSAMTVAYVH